ncbi:MAG TPA: flagellar hook protein FlgE [Steroidobacteraceae bacterium]|nr:flagellar hook protein FlgE [Steroidobacteraceae bacterium]
MSFRLALSGLNAASQDLTVTANNIANVATTGFKESRADFAEMFAVSPQGVAATATGNGVRVSSIEQQFTQGNIDNTGNSLDLAISGQGFFTMSDNGALVYTRAGSFNTDNAGYVVNAANQRLQVYPPAANGGFNTGTLTDLHLQAGESAPNATSSMQMVLNLPADAALPTTAPFDPTDTDSYNRATSLTVYDSLGAAHTGTVYFQKTGAGQWNSYLYVDGSPVGTLAAAQAGTGTGSVDTSSLTYPANYNLSVNGTAVGTGAANAAGLVAAVQTAVDTAVVAGGGAAGDAVVSLNGANQLVITNNSNVSLNLGGTDAASVFGSLQTVGPLVPAGSAQPYALTFDDHGNLQVPANGKITFPSYTPTTGAGAMTLTMDFSGATQYGSNFGVTSITQDGYTTGQLTGMNIDTSGVVEARFTNGQSLVLGEVALTNFANPNGLQQLADTTWSQTFGSGDALRGEAGGTGFGLIQSGSLEASNVDITEQLVNMITAQRDFQANAQMIQTDDQVTQTIINIR